MEKGQRRDMKQLINRIILAILVAQMIVPVVVAQDFGRQFDRPLLGDTSSGSSFRKTDQIQMGGNINMDTGSEALKNKGMMLTEPALSGLTYQVHVLGGIKMPGTYRITASDRLSEVIKTAGGIDEQGSERNIELRRQGEGTKKIDLLAFQLFGNLNDNPYLLDNDVVFIPLRGSTINVVGAVRRPREYEIRNEKTLSDAIKLAGGPSVGAARDKPINVVRFVNDKKELLSLQPTDAELAGFKIQNGDIIFIPHMITEKNTFDFDVPKLPGDNIFYPSFEDRVFILGGVNSPGAYTFNPYYTLPQYLSLAGGTSTMSTNNIKILSPEGKVTKITNKNRNTVIINPGDTVTIGQRRIPPEGWVSLFMSIASFSLATTATVLALKER